MHTPQIQFYLRKQMFVRTALITGFATLAGASGFFTTSDSRYFWLRVVMVALFGAFSAFFTYMAIRRIVVLTFSADGILSSTASKSVIPWENISAIKTVEIQRQKLLCLTVDRILIDRMNNTPFLEKRRRWMISRLQLTPQAETGYLFAAIGNLTESPEMIEKRVMHLHWLKPEARMAELLNWQNEQARR